MTYVRIETSEVETVRLEHYVAADTAQEALGMIDRADIVRVIGTDRQTTVHPDTARHATRLPWKAEDSVTAIRTMLEGDEPFTVHVRMRTMTETIEIAVVSIDETQLIGQVFPAASDRTITIPLADISSMRIEE